MSINELRSLAATLKLDSKGSRDNIFDTIVGYYDRYGWTSAASEQKSVTSHAVHTSGLSPAGESSEEESQPRSGDPIREATRYELRAPTPVFGATTAQNMANVSAVPDMQLIVDAVMQAMQQMNPQSTANQSRAMYADDAQRSERHNGGSLPIWQSVKCAEKLIPTFSGKDEENVIRWLERITNIDSVTMFCYLPR